MIRGLLVLLLTFHALAHVTGTDTALRAVRQQLASRFLVSGETSVDYLKGHWNVSGRPSFATEP